MVRSRIRARILFNPLFFLLIYLAAPAAQAISSEQHAAVKSNKVALISVDRLPAAQANLQTPAAQPASSSASTLGDIHDLALMMIGLVVLGWLRAGRGLATEAEK